MRRTDASTCRNCDSVPHELLPRRGLSGRRKTMRLALYRARHPAEPRRLHPPRRLPRRRRSTSSSPAAFRSTTSASGARPWTTRPRQRSRRHASWDAFLRDRDRRPPGAADHHGRRRRFHRLRFRSRRHAAARPRERRRARRGACRGRRAAAHPAAPGVRSLNVALAAAMVLGEALRQTDGFRR